MEELYRGGKIKAIGVCNFLPDRLVDLILSHEIVPAVNQIELHPFCQQRELRSVMKKYDIQAMAWAPFAEGQNHIFENKTLQTIGKKYAKSSAQDIETIEQMDTGESLILDVPSLEEVYRLHNIRFEQ